MDVLNAAWLIPALPLAGFVALVAFGRKLGASGYHDPRTSAWVLCVSADKRGVWSNSIGDMSGDPFDLPPEILARMPGVYA